MSSNFTSNKGLQFFYQFIDLSWPQASMVFDKFNVVSACLPEITNFSLFISFFFCFFATKHNSPRRKFHFNENKNCCLKFHAKIHVNSSTKLTLHVCFHQKVPCYRNPPLISHDEKYSENIDVNLLSCRK